MRGFVRIINDIERLGLFKGQTLEVSDFDVVTKEWIIHPSAADCMLGPNIRLKKGVNCKATIPICMPEDTYKHSSKVVIHVYTDGSRRFVEVIGYVYSDGEAGVDDSGEINPAYTYRIVKYDSNEMLLKNYQYSHIGTDYIDMLRSETMNATELEAFWWLNSFETITFLSEHQLNENTPDGWYLY